ncbi:MAG: PH domain-containing protein [Treponema sp.]|nr:PH domain-containing protein [Treponema sp.]
MENVIFFETITQPKSILSIIPVLLIILVLLGLFIGIIFAIKNTSISINEKDIVIKSFLYGRKIPINDVLLNEVQTINLKQNNDFNVSIRTNGIGLPNFLSGWMRLNKGQKALAFLTDKENVLLMPTKDFILLFSMEKTEEFITKLNGIK